jgi:tetratricopeptide (TPR) repeat protein
MPISPRPPHRPTFTDGRTATPRSSSPAWSGGPARLIAAFALLLLSAPCAAEASCLQVAPPEVAPPSAAAPSDPFPNDPRLDQALVMLRRGAFGPAATVARTVRTQRPGVDRATAILAIALEKEKRYEEARALLEAAAASTQPYPERRHVPHFLGWCCYHLGDLEAAKAAFEAHLAQMPDEPDSTFGLGLVALGEDRLDDADRHFAKALAGFSEPKPRPVDQARVLTRMSDVALRRDDVLGAERLLERAIAASALQHETWSKMARVRDRLGKHREAEAARKNVDRILESLGRRAPANGDGASPNTPTDPKTPTDPLKPAVPAESAPVGSDAPAAPSTQPPAATVPSSGDPKEPA